MIDCQKISKVRWHKFLISLPREIRFIDCWVTYYNGAEYHFRYYINPPNNVPYQIYRLGYPYNYLAGFGDSGELPYEFYSEFVYQCNNWYQYSLINFNSNGKENKNRASEGSKRIGTES